MPPLIQLVLLASMISVTRAQDLLVHCRLDGDCPENHYCYENLGNRICEPCIDCEERYFRKPSRNGCAKKSAYCGNCIEGFHQEKKTGGGFKAKCVANYTMPPSPSSDGGSDASNNHRVIYGLLGIVLCCLLAALCACQLYKQRKRNQRDPESGDPNISNQGSSGEHEMRLLRLHEQSIDIEARAPPPSYSEIERDQQVRRVERENEECNPVSVREGRSVAADEPHLSEELTHSGSHGQDKERLPAADPFNVEGYQRHVSGASSSPPPSPPREAPLRFDDGRLELSLEMAVEAAIGDDEDDRRPTSPADSVATEPSLWEPGQGTAVQEPDLSSIEENVEEENDQNQEEIAGSDDGDTDAGIEDFYYDSDDSGPTGPADEDDLEAGIGYVEGSEREHAQMARETASARFTLDSGIPYSYDEDTPFSTRPPSTTFTSAYQLILGQASLDGVGSGDPATDTVRSLPRESRVAASSATSSSALPHSVHVRSFSNIDLTRSSTVDATAPSSSTAGEKKGVKRKTEDEGEGEVERQKARNKE